MKNRVLIGPMVLVFALIITFPASAQETLTPEKKTLIKELMRLINATTNAEAFTGQLFDQLQNTFVTGISSGLLEDVPQQKLSPAEQKKLKSDADEAALRVLARFKTEFPKRINMTEILDQVGFETYGKYFNEQELKELVTIYKSPTAQKLVRMTPQILNDTIPKIEELVTPSINKLMDDLINEEKMKLKNK